jgi:hypothetical protein
LAWYNESGGFDPISSAEIPIWGLSKLIKAASENHLCSVEQCSEMIGYLNDSIYRSTLKDKYNFNFSISVHSKNEFIEYWSQKYTYKYENKYIENISNPLTEDSLLKLFEWKNGTPLSQNKKNSIIENYPINKNDNLEERYLNHNESGGAIWNIFFLHCKKSFIYPIFDQHTYRAMYYILNKELDELPLKKVEIYDCYKNIYIPFFNSFEEEDKRKVDKALFTFGQYLKIMKKFV